jgi:hypothetical protein
MTVSDSQHSTINLQLSCPLLEDAAVRQMRFAMILMTGAKSAVRDRDNRAEELRLLPRI